VSLKDRRKYLRKPADLAVEFDVEEDGATGGSRVKGTCTSLSLGGMFVEAAKLPAFGAKITVGFRLPEYEGQLEVAATVRWVSPAGMGLQFGRMGASETYSLTEYIAKLTEGPVSVRMA
jgi:hypothetical protein